MAVQTLKFTKELFKKAIQGYENYLSFEVTPDQFKAIERFCSGAAIESNYESAVKWAIARSETLDQEATENEAAGYGYELPMGCCGYEMTSAGVGYETTSGTLFFVFPDTPPSVMLPKARELGFHHQVIALVMAGIDPAFLEDAQNLHRFEGEELKAALCEKRSALFDPVLVPLGFPKQDTLEEVRARVQEVRDKFSDRQEDTATEDQGTEEDYEGEFH